MGFLSPSEVYELRDLLHDPRTAEDVAWTQRAQAVLDNHAIELLIEPSVAEGVPQHPGASAKQIVVYHAVLDALLENKYSRVACGGANRSGKTKGIVAAICKYIRDHAKDGEKCWCISPTWEKSVDGCQRELWETLPHFMFGKKQWTAEIGFATSARMTLVLPAAGGKVVSGAAYSGMASRGSFEVWFKYEKQALQTFEQSKVRFIWWNEAEREPILGSITPRLVGAGGKIFLDYVPQLAWHKTRIRSSTNPRHFYQHWRMLDNQHNMEAGEIEDARSNMTEREAAIKIDGAEGIMFGAVYPQFDPGMPPESYGRHVCKPFAIPADWPRYRCMDYGHRNPNATLWAALAPDNFKVPEHPLSEQLPGVERLFIYREHYTQEQTVGQNAAEVIGLSVDAEGEPERYEFAGRVVCDPSMFDQNQQPYPSAGKIQKARSIADLFKAAGLPVRKGKRAGRQIDEMAMINKVRLWFEHSKIMFFDTCKEAIREHEVWRMKENAEGESPGVEKPEDKDNHTCDALKELLAERLTFSRPRAQSHVVVEPEDAGPRRSRRAPTRRERQRLLPRD